MRVSRGTEGGAPNDVDWEKAAVDLPLQAGFSLATGNGRAEIEFEDASTLYLAENSVLIFNALDSTANVPYSELALLSGTVTLGIHPVAKGEKFVLRTPTDTMEIGYGQTTNLRVSAYMDAVGITPLGAGFIRPSKDAVQIVRPGHTDYFRDGRQVSFSGFSDPNSDNSYAAWDKWVAGRIIQRDQAMANMLQQTGLKAPVPGLDEMAGQGKFIDCPGHGKCWQPPAPSASQQATASQHPSLPTSRSSYSLVGEAPAPPVDATPRNYGSGYSGMMGYYGTGYDSMFFPCGPDSIYFRLAMMQNMGMGMGMGVMYGNSYMSNPYPWGWAVCHSGSWIYQQNQYMWLPGGIIQHGPPIRWIKDRGRIGFVPINPGDVKGKPPLNLQHGVFSIGNKSLSGGRTLLQPQRRREGSQWCSEGVNKTFAPSLQSTSAPAWKGARSRPRCKEQAQRGQAHSGPESRTGPLAHPALGIPIVFDHRSQSFMMSRQVVQGSNLRTISEPVGSFLARSGTSFGGNNGYQGRADGLPRCWPRWCGR